MFDILVLDGETLIDLPFSERRKRLGEALSAHVAPQIVSDDPAALEKFYNEALDAGHEGIMVKDPASLYQPGVRGKHWIKVKPEVDTLDLAVVPAVKVLSHLPILVDPSHGTGRRDKVAPMSRGAAAVGADGLIIEVHHEPDTALSDGPQSITPPAFAALVGELRQIAPVLGRTL